MGESFTPGLPPCRPTSACSCHSTLASPCPPSPCRSFVSPTFSPDGTNLICQTLHLLLLDSIQLTSSFVPSRSYRTSLMSHFWFGSKALSCNVSPSKPAEGAYTHKCILHSTKKSNYMSYVLISYRVFWKLNLLPDETHFRLCYLSPSLARRRMSLQSPT